MTSHPSIPATEGAREWHVPAEQWLFPFLRLIYSCCADEASRKREVAIA